MVSYSAHVPFTPTQAEQTRAIGDLVARAEGCRLWLGQTLTLEPHQLFAYGAGLGLHIPVGTAVTLMPLRHPYEAALQARSLALLTGHPLVAGYGPGSPDLQQALLGAPYRSPLTAARNYLTAVRGLLDGAAVEFHGALVGLDAAPHPRVDLGLGVLRPAMARLTGEIADVAITWLCPPSYLRDVLVPEIRRSARDAGRPAPRIVSVVQVAQDKPGRDPVSLALSVCEAHLRSPHYVDMLTKAGLTIDPEDPAAGARTLISSDTFLTGTVAELLEKLDTYRTAGVDEIVLNLSAVGRCRGVRVALRELEVLLAALGIVRYV